MSNAQGKLDLALPRQTGGIFSARFNANGQYCVSGGGDRVIRLWNCLTGALIQPYRGHGHEILSLSISPDSDTIASAGGDKAIFMWDLKTSTIARKFGAGSGHTHRVNSVRHASPRGQLLVSGSYDKTVRIWDCRSNRNVPIQVLTDATDSVSDVATQELPEITAASVDGFIRTYDLRTGKVLIDDICAAAVSIAITRDGMCLLVSCLKGGLLLLNKENGEALSTYSGSLISEFPIGCCVLYDDGTVAAGSEDGNLCVWDIVKGENPLCRIKVTDSCAAHAIDAHPTEPKVLVGTHDGQVNLWRIDNS